MEMDAVAFKAYTNNAYDMLITPEVKLDMMFLREAIFFAVGSLCGRLK